MTEYEILDLQASYVAALGADIMNFISINVRLPAGKLFS